MLTNYRAPQRSIPVGARSTKAIETPKVPSLGFNPIVSCPLTLVAIKRVLRVSLANEIIELRAQPQRVESQ
jgi:hypothetical protein